MRELYSSISGRLQFKILAPALDRVASPRLRGKVDSTLHSNLLFQAQLLRGRAYREYGPLAAELLPDGRHFQMVDPQSWHILLQDENGRVIGCSRYRPVRGGFEQLGASQSSLARSLRFGPILKRAVEEQFMCARRMNMQYGEAGAWALGPEARCSPAAVNVALMTFAVAERLGGGIGITTATTRHHSASILRRLGGYRLAELPAYYEPKFGCVIEVLGFDMANLDTQFAARIERLGRQLEQLEIVCATKEIGRRRSQIPDSPHPVPLYASGSAAAYAC